MGETVTVQRKARVWRVKDTYELLMENPDRLVERMDEAQSWGEAQQVLEDAVRKRGQTVEEVAV